jgi:hypothetical protein
MGKKSKLKTQRKLAKSSAQDLANFYLNAKNTEARQFRHQLVEEFSWKNDGCVYANGRSNTDD